VETIKLEAEIDAADQMEFGDQDPTIEFGIHPQIAALESMLYPTSRSLQENHELAASGQLQIIPMESPLALFVWSKSRIVPVRITDLSMTEEAFDPNLNPLRAKVSLSMRVLSVDDLGFEHKGGSIYMTYQKEKERLASLSHCGTLSSFGITGV
jgi:hypothetical protein